MSDPAGHDAVEALYQQLARFSGRGADAIAPGLSLADDLGIQSVTAIEMICALEEQLDVEIDIDGGADVQTVQDLVDELLRSVRPPPAGGGS